MDTSALRKLSLTLKPLIEIAEVLEKIDGADQQLAAIQGKTVAAKREYDALVAQMARDKDAADASAKAAKEKAISDAADIVDRAKKEAEAITKAATNSAASHLESVKKKIEKAEAEEKELSSKIKMLAAEAAINQKKADEAQARLDEIRAALAAARI